MLKRVGHPVDEKGAAVAIKDATFPGPFKNQRRILSCTICLRTGVQFTGSWQLEHRTYRNADAGGKTDLCLCR